MAPAQYVRVPAEDSVVVHVLTHAVCMPPHSCVCQLSPKRASKRLMSLSSVPETVIVIACPVFAGLGDAVMKTDGLLSGGRVVVVVDVVVELVVVAGGSDGVVVVVAGTVVVVEIVVVEDGGVVVHAIE